MVGRKLAQADSEPESDSDDSAAYSIGTVGIDGLKGAFGIARALAGNGASVSEVSRIKNQLLELNPELAGTVQPGQRYNVPSSDTPENRTLAAIADRRYQTSLDAQSQQRENSSETQRQLHRVDSARATDPPAPQAESSAAFNLAQNKGFAAYWNANVANGSTLARMVPRNEWAQYPANTTGMDQDKSKGQFTTITLHHTGSEDTPQEVEDLQRGHESAVHLLGRTIVNGGRPQKYGFADVGYNFMIAPNGTIYEGRSMQYEAAHVSNPIVGNKNPGNIGIAFLGNYADAPLTTAQTDSANVLMAQLNNVYHISARNPGGAGFIYTHADFDPSRHSELAGAAAQVQAMRQKLYRP